jgi:hypothetical protein
MRSKTAFERYLEQYWLSQQDLGGWAVKAMWHAWKAGVRWGRRTADTGAKQ